MYYTFLLHTQNTKILHSLTKYTFEFFNLCKMVSLLENSQPFKTLVFRLGEGVVWSGIVEVYSRQLGQLHRVH